MNLKKLVIAMALALPATGAMACASCGCSLNTDIGTQGMGSSQGWTFDLRYDNLNQNQLRSGTGTISQNQAANTINPKTGLPAEVEGFTQNNYVTASLDYNNGETWGATVVLPYIMRSHMTYGPDTDPGDGSGYPTGANGYSSQANGFGDMKIIGRYFGFAEQKDWGIQFGVKLPTGSNNQTAVGNSGSIVAVDPGLQLGTGSTDAIIGVYKFGIIPKTEDWGYFGNVQYQATVKPTNVPSTIAAINAAGGVGNSYRPGNALNINVGTNYQGWDKWVPTLQFNYLYKTADSGTAADTWSTGGTLLYATPGILYKLTDQTQVYANVQLPVYQNLNGIQLAPSFIASMGVRVHF
ncbi:hypothetical protein A9236_08555 [Polynucleobacter sp. QLW-P1DATA-2]|jgi:hypothetical protein|uniref:hypothetical protein n=1 Tax=unclassified Polynucleobacter TaxID=2640945 RepID=UPI0008F8D421|nr:MULTISPECIES: hypothetical protein [unclassified Polynucleobacter]OIN01196.1 hypothetical protein A9236_08555 [Polynucleobacter sp. QLW-P1DATA-2]OIN02766.1 hypothetical protein A9235_03605 [Polynucleobacter sp. MWH-Tro8-2-5-gr]